MTQKANPSVNRPAGAFKTSGAIAYGGHGGTGFVKEGSDPTDISVQDSAIDETALNSFEQSSSASSLTVTIDPGEAFVFGSWICKDTESNVTLESGTAGQTVFVGWNKSGPNDVIVGRESAFSSAEGDTDEKISLFSFDTDSSGVISVVDERSFDQISTDSIEQGSGSGLDSDTVDGQEAFELDTNAGDNLSKSGSTLNVVDGSGSGLDSDTVDGKEASELDTNAGDNLSKNGSTLNVVDGIEASDLGSSVSDSGTSEEDPATTINFVGNLTATGDGTGEATVNIDEGSGSGLDADTVDGLQADSFVEESGDTMTGDLDLRGTNTVTNLAEPSNNTDAATKQFTESVAQGLTIKSSVRVSNHDVNIDLSSSTDPNPIDGITVNDGDRILLKHQTDKSENGIYDAVTATDPTTWVRSDDFDEDAEVTQGSFTFVRGGTHANQSYVVITPDPITVGTDDIEFAHFSEAGQLSGGTNVSVSGDVIDVSPQGSGSGLDADTVDGFDIQKNGTDGNGIINFKT
jgi:hypothetical protein